MMETTSSPLKKCREAAGLTQSDLAERADTTRVQITRLETGARRMTKEWAERLAPHLGAEPQDLLFPDDATISPKHIPVRSIRVAGEAAAGVWREADLHFEKDYPPVPASPDPRYASMEQFALRVIGESMNKVLPDGTYAICVEYYRARHDFRDGDLVYVRRTEGGRVEATIKRLRTTNGKAELWPESTSAQFQKPIIYTNGGETCEVEIIGLVVGKYEPVL